MNATLTIKNYTGYKAETSCNGGDYGYEEQAILADGKIVGGFFWTTADFAYCPCCGRFEQRLNVHLEQWHNGDEANYQPSHEMEETARLLQTYTPEQVIARFAAVMDGLTLEIAADPVPA
jgi:hypothetical protein